MAITLGLNDINLKVETYEVYKTEDGRWKVKAWDREDEPVYDSITGRLFVTMGAARSAAKYAWPKAIEVFL